MWKEEAVWGDRPDAQGVWWAVGGMEKFGRDKEGSKSASLYV